MYTLKTLMVLTFMLHGLGMQRLQDHDPREVLREVGKLVVRLSNDKVPNIFQASLKVLRALLGVSANGVHQRDMSQLMSDMVPNLVEKVRTCMCMWRGVADCA